MEQNDRNGAAYYYVTVVRDQWEHKVGCMHRKPSRVLTRSRQPAWIWVGTSKRCPRPKLPPVQPTVIPAPSYECWDQVSRPDVGLRLLKEGYRIEHCSDWKAVVLSLLNTRSNFGATLGWILIFAIGASNQGFVERLHNFKNFVHCVLKIFLDSKLAIWFLSFNLV